MLYLIVASMVLMASPSSHACLGPQLEKAQDKEAIIKFVGRPIEYEMHGSAEHALVTFKVIKTLRGQPRAKWNLYFRSQSLPTNLSSFKMRFGEVIEVGARPRVAPGEKSDSKKSAYYIVDAACSTHGEDWLLRKVK